jgi:hypothetical protein
MTAPFPSQLVPATAALAVFAFTPLLGGCGESGSGGGAARPTVESTLTRERVAVLFSDEEYGRALEEISPLINGPSPEVGDLVVAAQATLKTGDFEGAMALVTRALEAAPDDPGANYLQARLVSYDPDRMEEVPALYERVLELAPGDPPSKLGLARALLGLEEDLDRAEEALDEVVALGIELGLQWYVTAVYQRYRYTAAYGEDEEELRAWDSLWTSLREKGFKSTNDVELDQGLLARVTPPAPFGSFPAAPAAAPTFGEERTIAPLGPGVTDLEIRDLDGDRTLDLVTVQDGALVVHLRDGGDDSKLESTPLAASGVTGPIRALDLNQRLSGDTLDVVAGAGDRLLLFEQSDADEGPRWAASPVTLPSFEGEIRDIETVDFDHDGDLDLLVVGTFGARLLSNDGAGALVDKDGNVQPRGAWRDASAAATLPEGAFDWCAVEDLDGDNDVDLLFGGAGGTHLMDSLRRGLFEDIGASALGGATFEREPTVADLDADGRPDLLVPGNGGSRWFRRTAAGTYEPEALDVAVSGDSHVEVTDLDMNGAVDLVWVDPTGTCRGLLDLTQPAPLPFEVPNDGSRDLLVRDIDRPDPYAPLTLEVLQLTGDGLVAVSPTNAAKNALLLKFVGQKDNRQAVGAVLEVRAQDLYRRVYLRGEAAIIGIGDRPYADVVRVSWPNGVVQQELDVEAGVQFFLDNSDFGVQPEGLIGSCPFLYTWNGETFEFISDVIGITPLGLPMAPGMLVPPDHDEYVLVRGDQLVPDENDELVLQFTEELREVTYLDRVRLDVVDHPAGTAIYPNERFKFPPFPEPHTHVVERVAKVRKATGSDGADWTAEIRDRDSVHPVPFQRLAGQYLGLAEPHWLELEFDPADVKDAELLRMVATGWFFWSDASANVASAATPGVEFIPPVIEVPGPDGTWVPAGPPVGFPAGKTKTMVIDVSQILNREDPRMRLGSTLELYWDCIELATCDDDAGLITSSLEPIGTRLWSRGFSEGQVPDRQDLPLFFDWDKVAMEPRWDQHPGNYTRYGAVGPLLTEVDDQYVIMGSGDALTLRFDASELPPIPEGHVRDYLVFLDGWAKDRDHNTYEALEVEPLPFHAMSGYPYPDTESFPDTPEHRAWRAEWNTRPAHRWVVPMAPALETEWVHAMVEVGADR